MCNSSPIGGQAKLLLQAAAGASFRTFQLPLLSVSAHHGLFHGSATQVALIARRPGRPALRPSGRNGNGMINIERPRRKKDEAGQCNGRQVGARHNHGVLSRGIIPKSIAVAKAAESDTFVVGPVRAVAFLDYRVIKRTETKAKAAYSEATESAFAQRKILRKAGCVTVKYYKIAAGELWACEFDYQRKVWLKVLDQPRLLSNRHLSPLNRTYKVARPRPSRCLSKNMVSSGFSGDHIIAHGKLIDLQTKANWLPPSPEGTGD